MGNDASTERQREAFARLDSDGDALLTLDQLLQSTLVPGVTLGIENSPLLLFRFDEGRDGALDFQEWQKFLEHVKEAQKRVVKLRKLQKKQDSGLTVSNNTSSSGYGKVWTSVTRESAASDYNLGRDAETPAFTGRDAPSEGEEGLNALERKRKEAEEEMLLIEEELKADAKKFLEAIIATPKGRKRVISWLWELADVDKSNSINLHELTQLLRALRIDGIMADDLSFLDRERSSSIFPNQEQGESEDQANARRLMAQYDLDKDGLLKKRDFKNLANMVISHYRKLTFEAKRETIGPYHLKGILGQGTFGVVRLAVDERNKEQCAVKIVGKGDVNDMARVDTEIKAMMMLHHPNVARLENVMEGEKHVFFIMELCGGGNLNEFIADAPLSEATARFFFAQVVAGVAYSHAAGVCHRDLKLDNLLLDNQANIKIADFGHAGVYQHGWDVFSTPLVGGLSHIAPEQIRGQAYSGEKMDVWSLGVILFNLLYAKAPFKGEGHQEMFDHILHGQYNFPTDPEVSKAAKNLMSAMLQVDYQQRPSAEVLLTHPWFQGDVVHPRIDVFTIPVQRAQLTWQVPDSYAVVCHLLCGHSMKHVYADDCSYNIGFVTLYSQPNAKRREYPHVKAQNPEQELRCAFYFSQSDGIEKFVFKLKEGMARHMINMRRALLKEIAMHEKKLQQRSEKVSSRESSLYIRKERHKEEKQRGRDKEKDRHGREKTKSPDLSEEEPQRRERRESKREKDRDGDKPKDKDSDKGRGSDGKRKSSPDELEAALTRKGRLHRSLEMDTVQESDRPYSPTHTRMRKRTPEESPAVTPTPIPVYPLSKSAAIPLGRSASSMRAQYKHDGKRKKEDRTISRPSTPVLAAPVPLLSSPIPLDLAESKLAGDESSSSSEAWIVKAWRRRKRDSGSSTSTTSSSSDDEGFFDKLFKKRPKKKDKPTPAHTPRSRGASSPPLVGSAPVVRSPLEDLAGTAVPVSMSPEEPLLHYHTRTRAQVHALRMRDLDESLAEDALSEDTDHELASSRPRRQRRQRPIHTHGDATKRREKLNHSRQSKESESASEEAESGSEATPAPSLSRSPPIVIQRKQKSSKSRSPTPPVPVAVSPTSPNGAWPSTPPFSQLEEDHAYAASEDEEDEHSSSTEDESHSPRRRKAKRRRRGRKEDRARTAKT